MTAGCSNAGSMDCGPGHLTNSVKSSSHVGSSVRPMVRLRAELAPTDSTQYGSLVPGQQSRVASLSTL